MNGTLVVTTSRADFGLLTPLIVQLRNKSQEVRVLATRASSDFDPTSCVIDNNDAGIIADYFVEISPGETKPGAIIRSHSYALARIAEVLERVRPQLVVLLGDRSEVHLVSHAVTLFGVPIAHIHGGEITEGAIDDKYRHAITKLSTLHFVVSQEAGRRVLQMGEHESRVHVVGGLGAEVAQTAPTRSKKELEKLLGRPFVGKIIVLAFHPETEKKDSLEDVVGICNAIERLPFQKTVVVSGSNYDEQGYEIEEVLHSWCDSTDEAVFVKSFGHKPFISLLTHSDVLVGNSSSGVLEAPFIGTPAVNVGNRQAGRRTYESTISCEPNESSVYASLLLALDKDFKKSAVQIARNLGKSRASSLICREIIRFIELPSRQKIRFVDRLKMV